MTILAKKSLGTDIDSGLAKEVWLTNIQINGDTDSVEIQYKIVLLGPTGKLIQTKSSGQYRRFDRQAEKYQKGEIITPEALNEEGEIITAAVVSDGTQNKKEANLKFTLLKESQVGQAILGMLAGDLKDVHSEETLDSDLIQD